MGLPAAGSRCRLLLMEATQCTSCFDSNTWDITLNNQNPRTRVTSPKNVGCGCQCYFPKFSLPISNFKLHNGFISDNSSSVYSDEVKEHLQAEFNDINKSNLGLYLKYAFPKVVAKRARKTGDWVKNHVIYVGIRKRDPPTAITFSDIDKHMPSDFFILQRSEEEIVIGKDSGLLCLGNRIIIELSLTKAGKVHVQVQQKPISNVQIGIYNQIVFTDTMISSLFCAVGNIRLCKGLESKTESLPCEITLPIQGKQQLNQCKQCLRKSTKPLQTLPGDNCNNITNFQFSNTEDVLSSPVKENLREQPTPGTISSVLAMVKTIAPNITKGGLTLIESQLKSTNVVDPHGRRWDSEVIQLCLSIWNRSPSAYEEICASGALVLPSAKTLSGYKNAVEQKPGINENVLHWMFLDAKNRQLPAHGYYGGLVFDEMTIQDDLQIHKKQLVGLPDLGSEGNFFAKHSKNKLATHVLQFIFQGYTGFRFLVAHYPTTQATSNQIFSVFWNVVQALERWNFHVDYICFDGAAPNRGFTKMNFTTSPLDYQMAAVNPVNQSPLFFIPDSSHLFKKIRNNILSSGEQQWHTRLLKKEGKVIKWLSFIKCYHWDKKHGLAIHHKLTYGHFHLNPADKMRNHLAEEVLDKNMLHLMSTYVENHPLEADEFVGPIELLKKTSILIDIFHDRRPVKDHSDERFRQLQHIQEWFHSWEKDALKDHLMSAETREDIQWLLSGFVQLCSHSLKSSHHAIVPAFVNSDTIENIFSQQRGIYHGAGSNPNYLQYCFATNAVTLGQSAISKKTNTGKRKPSVGKGAVPYSHLCKKLRLW